ncbi:ankyrin repeat-containing domain protein, partial [Coprinopsis sp. MPI-PUGE-AT-0042]
DVLSKATDGTGVWLLRNEKFLIWLDANGDLKILWGTGIPGAGKTVMASIVIRELEARAARDSRICVCYVYIRYSDCAELTVRNVLEVLVKQTVERHPDCISFVEAVYSRHIHEKTQPSEVELLQLLHQFVGARAATFYVLDALDEVREKIQLELVRKLASLNVRLFITCRPLKAVEARVPGAFSFAIVAQEQDLDIHIAQEIARSAGLQDLLEKEGPSLREEIVSMVKSKCGGMFLHASLQLDALRDCVTAHEVRQNLDAFPSSIEDVYLQTWRRILEQNASHVLLAKSTLVWVMNASRSMRIEELERAVATTTDTYKFQRNRVAPGSTLIALCRGLVTFEEESKIVRLVHYTAKDTLQGLLMDSFPHPHSHLAMVCITHLKECGFQNTTLQSRQEFNVAREADPLLAYASDAWVAHARESFDVESTRQQTANFITGCNAHPSITYTGPPICFDILCPLHILAIHNLPVSLITQGNICNPNVATRIDKDSSLTLASVLGHVEIIEVLLACAETQVNFVDIRGQSSLMFAARYGHESIVKLLLACPGILINLIDYNGRSALMQAASNGVATLLLARPEIQVNLVNKEGCSALMLAASNGQESVVASLFARPEIQVNLVDIKGWSALMKAAHDGHDGIVTLLLARPEIQVNQVNNKRWSALMHAAANGHAGVVKLLLARPEIQVTLVDNEGFSALILAARWGHAAIVRLLLGGPHLNSPMKTVQDRQTAMSIALANGHMEVAQLL